jgi:DNA-binding transcriptional LysR family regulator
MRKDIPNLGALQAFEASARLGSFTRAATELALTQSAVGRQVAMLEQRLGVALFSRVRKRLTLTDVGREYAARIRRHLDQIRRDTLEISAGHEMGFVLELAVVPTFATQWLIPRLPDFSRLHPNITVNLSARSQPFPSRKTRTTRPSISATSSGRTRAAGSSLPKARWCPSAAPRSATRTARGMRKAWRAAATCT